MPQEQVYGVTVTVATALDIGAKVFQAVINDHYPSAVIDGLPFAGTVVSSEPPRTIAQKIGTAIQDAVGHDHEVTITLRTIGAPQIFAIK